MWRSIRPIEGGMKRRLRFRLRSDFVWLPPCLLLLGGR